MRLYILYIVSLRARAFPQTACVAGHLKWNMAMSGCFCYLKCCRERPQEKQIKKRRPSCANEGFTAGLCFHILITSVGLQIIPDDFGRAPLSRKSRCAILRIPSYAIVPAFSPLSVYGSIFKIGLRIDQLKPTLPNEYVPETNVSIGTIHSRV